MWRPVADQGLFPREITQGRHKVPVVNDWFVLHTQEDGARDLNIVKREGWVLFQQL